MLIPPVIPLNSSDLGQLLRILLHHFSVSACSSLTPSLTPFFCFFFLQSKLIQTSIFEGSPKAKESIYIHCHSENNWTNEALDRFCTFPIMFLGLLWVFYARLWVFLIKKNNIFLPSFCTCHVFIYTDFLSSDIEVSKVFSLFIGTCTMALMYWYSLTTFN